MAEPLTTRIFGRRRNFLINSHYQHRMSILTTLLALLPPAIFFGVYYLITSEGSRRIVEADPALAELVRGQDRTESLLILAAVIFYGVGVYLVAMMESHRTAGFMHRLEMRMKEIQDGNYAGAVNPRKDDNFLHMAATINDLGRVLRARAEDDLALLEEVNSCLESTAPSVGQAAQQKLGDLQARVEAFARLKRSHLHADGEAQEPIRDVPAVLDARDPADASPPVSS